MPSSAAIAEFTRRVRDEWLPAYCADPARNYSVNGFRSTSVRVSEVDAVDCMRAIDHRVVTDHGGGRYKAPRSTVREVLFWEGLRNIAPRPITLWIEPVITMAAAARLNLDYGWPKGAIGLQSKKWGFDFVAYASPESDQEHIVGEVKKTDRELQKLISDLKCLSGESNGPSGEQGGASPNSRKKWDELLQRKPPILWALGPAGAGAVFAVTYPQEHCAVLTEATHSVLNYPNAA